MTKQNSLSRGAAELRLRAERELGRQEATRSASSQAEVLPDEARRLIHELQVHQIELEMQNDELRRTTEELETSRARYFELYDLAPVGYLTVSERGLIHQANLAAATLFGVPRGTLVNQPLTRFLASEDQDAYYHCRRRLSETGLPQSCEVRVSVPLGLPPRWAQLEATISQNPETGDSSARIALVDVSGLKQAEQALHRALAEKELLLKEVHHRVKNNLFAVTTLLSLRSDAAPNPETRAFLLEVSEKARVMALVYQRVFQGRSVPMLEMGDFLRELGTCLSEALSNGVPVEVEATDITLPIHLATPCGLIVNELVTNSLKYAFLSERSEPPRVSVLLAHSGERIELTVRDNGVGFAGSPDCKGASSLGLKLVHEWALSQLQGEIALEGPPGATWRVAFPAPQPADQDEAH